MRSEGFVLLGGSSAARAGSCIGTEQTKEPQGVSDIYILRRVSST